VLETLGGGFLLEEVGHETIPMLWSLYIVLVPSSTSCLLWGRSLWHRFPLPWCSASPWAQYQQSQGLWSTASETLSQSKSFLL
jgi:hypothetical protein